MSTTWYKADRWENKITPVEVLKETEKFVVIHVHRYSSITERRVAKAGEYFPTFKEARGYLMDHFKSVRERCKHDMDRADKNWNKLFLQEEQT
jgi:hypothetical protein